jgi:crotonobetainyl-CoA:carnitine CoA-transferase CaiB-like acyl-CoA transferase
MLGSLGADVIKVESTKRPDLMRLASTRPPTFPEWWEWGGAFHGVNTNKRGVAVDLGSREGKAAFERLVGTADLLVENYTPRVMEQLGLGWPRLKEVNPKLVMLRMPAFGLDGPWRDRGGFAQTMEGITGMAWVTGFEDGPPVLVRGTCDPLSGMHAVIAALLALRVGGGRMVESVMVEAALNAAAEQVVEYEASGHLLTRCGNAGLPGTVQGLFRCAGEDRWIAIAAVDDDQRAALAAHVGGTTPQAIAAFCADREAEVLAEQLMAEGVPSGNVIPARDLAKNPQLRHRGIFEMADHPVLGRREMVMLPFRLSRVQRWLSRPSPTVGQHNDEVLEPIIGRSELARLRDNGVVGEGVTGY